MRELLAFLSLEFSVLLSSFLLRFLRNFLRPTRCYRTDLIFIYRENLGIKTDHMKINSIVC